MKPYTCYLGRRAMSVLFVILVVAVVPIITGLLVGCHPESTVDRSVLTDSPCAAPCWQGIVPGTTLSKDEVVRLLKEQRGVGRVWINGSSVMWHWREWPWEGTSYNSIYLMGDVVHNITLYFAFELTVEELVDKYGIPDTTTVMQAWTPPAYVVVQLFYPTRGLSFKIEGLPVDNPVLDPTARVSEAVYTIPADSLEAWQDSHSYLHLQPWPGYGKLEEVFDPHNP